MHRAAQVGGAERPEMARKKVLLSIDEDDLAAIDEAVAQSDDDSRSSYIARAAVESARATCKRCGGTGREPQGRK